MIGYIFFMLVISVLHHMTFIYKNEVIYDPCHVANVSSCRLHSEIYSTINKIEPGMSFFTMFITFIAWLAILHRSIKINKEFVQQLVFLAIGGIFPSYIITCFTMMWVVIECKGWLFNWYIAVFLSKTLYIYTILLIEKNIMSNKETEEEKFKNYFN